MDGAKKPAGAVEKSYREIRRGQIPETFQKKSSQASGTMKGTRERRVSELSVPSDGAASVSESGTGSWGGGGEGQRPEQCGEQRARGAEHYERSVGRACQGRFRGSASLCALLPRACIFQ